MLRAVDIAHHAHGVVVAGSADAAVSSWAFDSRTLTRGACFAALRGGREGPLFVPAAFAAGASVALVSQTRDVEPPPGAALVRVDDVLRRLQDLARTARAARPALRVVGGGGAGRRRFAPAPGPRAHCPSRAPRAARRRRRRFGG